MTADHDERRGAATQDSDALATLLRRAGKRATPSPDEHARVLAASREAWRRKVRAGRRRRSMYALAASLAVAAIGVAVVQRPAPPPVPASMTVVHGRVEILDPGAGQWRALLAPGPEVALGARVRTSGESRAAFRLPGGAALRMDAVTEWAFAGTDRIELVDGALYVDSGERLTADGLEIATPFGVVRDVGTQFELRTLGTSLRVRVREGLVQLRGPDRAPPLETGSGEQLTVAADGSVQRQPVSRADAEWAWAETLAEPLRLDGRSAFEVLTWVARETGRTLIFEDANAELRARNSVLSGGDSLTPMQALEVAIATSDGLDYSLGDGTLIVRRR
jgi:ferric-dicitrate binding protein FerR (iron transport regulator)